MERAGRALGVLTGGEEEIMSASVSAFRRNRASVSCIAQG